MSLKIIHAQRIISSKYKTAFESEKMPQQFNTIVVWNYTHTHTNKNIWLLRVLVNKNIFT